MPDGISRAELAATYGWALSVLRSDVFYALILAAAVVACLYVAVLAGPPRGFGWVTLGVTVVLGVLLAQQVWQRARDAGAAVVAAGDALLR